MKKKNYFAIWSYFLHVLFIFFKAASFSRLYHDFSRILYIEIIYREMDILMNR